MAVARELGSRATPSRGCDGFDAAIQPGPRTSTSTSSSSGSRPSEPRPSTSARATTRHQAIFGLADSPAAAATTIADLKGLKIGARRHDQRHVRRGGLQPDQEPLIFNDNAAAKPALESNQIDAVVADLPTAIYITAVEIEGTKVFGQIEGSGTEQWGLLLAKDSPLTECVDLSRCRR